jgi:hypothetical protein
LRAIEQKYILYLQEVMRVLYDEFKPRPVDEKEKNVGLFYLTVCLRKEIKKCLFVELFLSKFLSPQQTEEAKKA